MPNNDPTLSLTATAALRSTLCLLCCSPWSPTNTKLLVLWLLLLYSWPFLYTELCCFPWMLNNKQTPPVMATAALPLPKTLPTLLLPSNSLTITKLPLFCLLLLTLQPYLLAASPECLTNAQLLLWRLLLLYLGPTYIAASPVCFNNDPAPPFT